ncbi:MAG: histidine kinase N-terminal 7TM domain-containing protein, partial [Halolamina sp.]
MGIPNAALVAVLLFEIAIAGGITYLTWEHRERVRREMVLPLLAALLFALIWQMSTVLMLLSPTRNLQIFFHQLGWNMDFATTVPWLLFTLYYTGRDHLVTARNLAAVFLPFGALTLGMWTPQLGELYFTNYVMVGSDPAALAVDYGPLFWVAITYGYSIMGLGMVFIVEKFLNSPAYRKPIAILLGGVFIPWIASVIQFSGVIEPIRLQPTVYVVLTVFIAWYIAIFHMDVLEVLPIARDQVLDLIEEGVVVTDRTGRIIDANPAACASLGDGLVGQPLQPVLGRYVTNPEGVISDQRISREVSFEDEEETRHFELVSSPISASDAEYGEGQVGHLLLLRDVTPIREREMELRNRKEELERQNERLDKFATVISHDLRNPLTVARGFLDLARRTGDESAFENADHALDRIEEIIEGLLSLAR